MSDEEAKTQLSRYDQVTPAVDPNAVKQVPVRLHINDWRACRKMLIDDELNWRKFTEAVVDAYLKRDPLILKILVDWRDRVEPKKKAIKDRFVLSPNEKKNLFDELEDSDPTQE